MKYYTRIRCSKILEVTKLFYITDDHSDYGSTVSGGAGKSPGPMYPNTTFTFPGQPPPPGGVITHKTAVYYHHQLSLQEDQGIDMTQVCTGYFFEKFRRCLYK